MLLQDDDTISQKSYGSHKIRSFKDESHKVSADTIDGEEKKDASKEELGLEEGKNAIDKEFRVILGNHNILTYHDTPL